MTDLLSPQQVFDRVATHLIQQGHASFCVNDLDNPTCMYRGPYGAKCAVGCLISDDDYKPEYEGKSATVSDIFKILPVEQTGYMESFVSDLQSAHDIQFADGDFDKWLGQMFLVAKDFNLSANVLTPELEARNLV